MEVELSDGAKERLKESRGGLTKEQMAEIHKAATYVYYQRYSGERFRNLIEFEDFKQECVVKVWRSQFNKASKFQNESQYSTWVHQVCKNHYLNMVKSVQTTKRSILLALYAPDDVSQWIEDCGAGQEKENVPEDMSYVQTEYLEDQIVFEELKELAWERTQERFPKEVWDTFLQYMNGVPSNAIADELGVPHSTVRTRVHRVKKYISDILSGEIDAE